MLRRMMWMAGIGLGLLFGSEATASAQVAGATFTTYAISLTGSVKPGSMQFDADGSTFIYLPQGGQAQPGTYAESIDATTGNSSLTITGQGSQPNAGLSIAVTRNFNVNSNLPVVFLFGISGNPRKFNFVVGYYLPNSSG